MNTTVPAEQAIRAIVRSAVEGFADGFVGRHSAEASDPDGTINMKIHNPFIAALGMEVQYYSALSRSLDSSLGSMIESMALNIASLSYDVERHVEGPLAAEQTRLIAALLERYKRRENRSIPSVADYQSLRTVISASSPNKRHESDYYLLDRETGIRYLIELKIGGDLDNKKARAEKEALLEQYAILCNVLGLDADVRILFATAYNRFGEGRPWRQERVRQFFADEELLVGSAFWNFIVKSPGGFELVMDAYRQSAPSIVAALGRLRRVYLQS